MGALVESGVEKELVVSMCFSFVTRRDEMDRLLGFRLCTWHVDFLLF